MNGAHSGDEAAGDAAEVRVNVNAMTVRKQAHAISTITHHHILVWSSFYVQEHRHLDDEFLLAKFLSLLRPRVVSHDAKSTSSFCLALSV